MLLRLLLLMKSDENKTKGFNGISDCFHFHLNVLMSMWRTTRRRVRSMWRKKRRGSRKGYSTRILFSSVFSEMKQLSLNYTTRAWLQDVFSSGYIFRLFAIYCVIFFCDYSRLCILMKIWILLNFLKETHGTYTCCEPT